MSDEPTEVRWQDYSLCQHFTPGMWFEEYETDPRTAKVADSICLSCPVRAPCYQAGVEGGEYGTWGGVFLNNGKIDPQKNEHKTPDIWKQIRADIG